MNKWNKVAIGEHFIVSYEDDNPFQSLGMYSIYKKISETEYSCGGQNYSITLNEQKVVRCIRLRM